MTAVELSGQEIQALTGCVNQVLFGSAWPIPYVRTDRAVKLRDKLDQAAGQHDVTSDDARWIVGQLPADEWLTALRWLAGTYPGAVAAYARARRDSEPDRPHGSAGPSAEEPA